MLTLNKKAASDIATYVSDTQDIINAQSAEISSLRNKVASCGEADCQADEDGKCTKCGTGQDKTANLNYEAVESTVDKIVRAGFLKEGSRQQALQAIQDDAAGSLLSFVDKLADQRIESDGAGAMIPKLGHAVTTGQESTSSQMRESDLAFEQCFKGLTVR